MSVTFRNTPSRLSAHAVPSIGCSDVSLDYTFRLGRRRVLHFSCKREADRLPALRRLVRDLGGGWDLFVPTEELTRALEPDRIAGEELQRSWDADDDKAAPDSQAGTGDESLSRSAPGGVGRGSLLITCFFCTATEYEADRARSRSGSASQ